MFKEFTKFPSLENTYRQKEIDKIVMMEIKDQWVVTEKVHGANFSFWVYKNVETKEIDIKCAKRKALQVEVFDKSQSNGWFVAIALLTVEIIKLSEQIGKNGHKIQRLRTKYKQFGNKWVENKLKPKRTQDICY